MRRKVIGEADLALRLTSDIYPGDLGWTVNWDKPEERQEWYHNMSSVMQAGPCVRSNQLDYDEDVMHKVGNFALKYTKSCSHIPPGPTVPLRLRSIRP